MLEISGVDALRGDTRVLHDVSLRVGVGEMVALIGRNGMGKTTLLRAILGQCTVTRGHIRFEGEDLRGKPTHRVARLGIGVVPEGRGMFSTLTVRESLLMGGHRSKAATAALAGAFDRFPVLRERADDKAGSLSGGQQQVLAIARALISKPKLLLIDEFSEGIQPNLVQEIAAMLCTLQEEGLSILLVEQNARLALRTAQRGYILEKGRIVVEGNAPDLLADEGVLTRHLVV
ncbi:MAG: ABC transporter ATP-binding protein [Microcella pacifica]